MNNYEKIVNMDLKELAKEFVVPVTFMCGYRSQTIFRSVHTGDYDSEAEALAEEIKYLNGEDKI